MQTQKNHILILPPPRTIIYLYHIIKLQINQPDNSISHTTLRGTACPEFISGKQPINFCLFSKPHSNFLQSDVNSSLRRFA